MRGARWAWVALGVVACADDGNGPVIKPDDGLLTSGASCAEDAECHSGVCVDLGAGRECGALCAGPCAAGRVCKRLDGRDPTTPSICTPPSSRLCQPCAADHDCSPFGDLCLPRDGALYCSVDCSETGACPDGYTCESVRGPAGQELSRQCVPVSGTCTCSDLNNGLTRVCEKTTPSVGTCLGEETCVGGVGWVSCNARTPVPELCDRVDNDCDGQTDENAADSGPLSRTCGYGPEPRRQECAGVEVCDNGIFQSCNVGPPPASEISCDGLDDDCDGAVDEGLLNDPDNCGGCGDVCPPGAASDFSTTRSCDQSMGTHFCGAIGCRIPYFDVNGDEMDGCEVEDDHVRVGDTVVLNSTWPEAFAFADELMCPDGTFVTDCGRRIPSDNRQHAPVAPPSPNEDHLVFFAQDTIVNPICEPDTWICAYFAEARPEDLDTDMEVCASTVVADLATAPTFPPGQCSTFTLSVQNWVSLQVPNNDGGYVYIRVRSTRGHFAGSYAVAAYDFAYMPFQPGYDFCPLGTLNDPCTY